MAVQRRDSPAMEAAEQSAQQHAARQLEGEEPADEQARSSHEGSFSRMRSSSCASSIGDEPPCGSEGTRNARAESAASAARSSTSSCSEAGSGACEISVERETLLSPNAEDSSADAEGGEELPHKCSNLQATANTVNLLLGMGSLSLPFAVRSAGWLPGLGLLLSVSLLSAFAARTLWRTLLHLDAAGIPSRTYVDVAEAALGRAGGVLVTALFLGDFLGACTCLVIVFVDNMRHVLPHVDKNTLLLVFIAIVLPTVWTSRLSSLSYLSLLGAFSMCFLLGVLLFEGAAMAAGIIEVGSNSSAAGEAFFLEQTHTRLFTSFSEAPISIGLVLIVFGGHAAFPAVADSLQDKRDFGQVINVSFLIVASFYLSVASVGYFMFGEATRQEITLNLGHDRVDTIAALLISVNPLTTFGLLINSVGAAVERWLPGAEDDGRGTAELVEADEEKGGEPEEAKRKPTLLAAKLLRQARERLLRCLLRTALAAVCVVLAVSIPDFARVVAFVGSMFAGMLSGIFPSLFFLAVRAGELGRRERALHAALVVAFGGLAALGTYGSVFGRAGAPG